MYNALQNIGNWPPDTEDACREKRLLHIPPDKAFHLLHGREHQIRYSLFVSNDRVHVGILTVREGRFSDPEDHQGDEALIVLEGTLQIRVIETPEDEKGVSHTAWKIEKGEKFFVPQGTKHQYFNLGRGVLKVLFTVAPGL